MKNQTASINNTLKVTGFIFFTLILAVLFALIESDSIRLVIIVAIPVLTLFTLYILGLKENKVK